MSLQSYAERPRTRRRRARRADAAAPLRRRSPRFDSGYWSYYALPGDWSPLDYQQYVVALLKRLGPSDERFASAASRFAAYAKQPPAFKVDHGQPRLAALLALEARDRHRDDRRRATKRALALRRLAHARLDGAEARGLLCRARRRRRLGGQPRVVRHAADRARRRDGSEAEAPPATPRPTRLPAPPLVVGAGIADPAPGPAAVAAGLRLVRFGVSWPAGAAAPDPGLVAALQRVPARLGIVVDLYAAPVRRPGRAALAQYGASLVQQVPSIRDVLLTPAPTVAAAPSYAATLAALRNAVVPTGIPAAVGPLVDGAQNPKAVLAAIGQALAATGAVADVVGFKPAPAVGKNLWTAANVPQVTAAVGQGFANAPPVLVDGVVATPTAAADLILGAACSTTVQGIVLEQLTADARLTAAVAAAQRGTVVCPGLAAGVDATTLTFPRRSPRPRPAQVVLGCSRDCLYLVTLVRADGTPVVAKRGALAAEARPPRPSRCRGRR